MEFWLFLSVSLILSIVVYFGAGYQGRRFLFYTFWLIGNLCLGAAIFLFLSVPLFDQDLQSLPYYKISLAIGIIWLIASQIAAVISGRSALYIQLGEERQERAISEITQVAVSSTSLMELLNFTLDKIVSMLGMSGGAIHIFHRARKNLVLGSYKGLTARLARRLETVEFGETAIGRTARNKRLLIIRNLRLSPDYEFFGGKTEDFSYMALIPVISEGEHWGVITLFGKGVYRAGMLHVDLLEQFGEQLGAALVLGRQMRATQSSVENMRSLLSSLGDELYISSRVRRGGGGAARAVAWSLTRILDGDHFDLCFYANKTWKIGLSSEPDADGQTLTLNPESKFDAKSGPSGIISRDQPPPFKEFIDRRPYIFCSLEDNEVWVFIRLESRRRPSVDFDFFYNVCRIIHGLLLRSGAEVSEKKKDIRELEPPRESADEDLQKADAAEIIEATFGQISGDLERLIKEYSKSNDDTELKGLIGWLEVIQRSASEGADLTQSLLETVEATGGRAGDFNSMVREAVDNIARSGTALPKIEFKRGKKSITVAYSREKISDIISRFLSMAAGEAGQNGVLRLTASGEDREICLEVEGEKLSPAPEGGDRPSWVKEVNGRLEFARTEDSDTGARDRWRLIMPLEESPTEVEEVEKRQLRVLAVDSQDVIRDLLTSMLTNMGYDSTVVGDSAGALSVFKEGIKTGKRFDIVIADNALEDITGLELASQMKPLDPAINFILISGWGPDPDPAEIEKCGIGMTLKKPFRIEQLSDAMAKATGTAHK